MAAGMRIAGEEGKLQKPGKFFPPSTTVVVAVAAELQPPNSE